MKKDFKDWIAKKVGFSEFLSFTLKNKKELFLQWKHGFKNPNSNESCEMTDKFLYGRWKDMERMNWGNIKESARVFFKKRLAFENHCRDLWRQIETKQITEY